MAAISANAFRTVGAVSATRTHVASSARAVSMPARAVATKSSMGFASQTQRRNVAMAVSRGRSSTNTTRGFEVVAQAISEVRIVVVIHMSTPGLEPPRNGRDGRALPAPADRIDRFHRQNPDLNAKKRGFFFIRVGSDVFGKVPGLSMRHDLNQTETTTMCGVNPCITCSGCVSFSLGELRAARAHRDPNRNEALSGGSSGKRYPLLIVFATEQRESRPRLLQILTSHPKLFHLTLQPATTETVPESAADATEAVCYLRGVHMSPYKVRRVLDVIRGKSYEECLIMLEFMPYRACEPVLNALFSAASNAKNNLGMNKAKLYVSEVTADGTGTMKRFHPRAQGRPFPIRKRTCNITLKMKER
jgi:large subunit ribosomal protein L22